MKQPKPLRRTAVIKATRRLERLRANHARMRHILRAKDVLAKREAAEKVYNERP